MQMMFVVNPQHLIPRLANELGVLALHGSISRGLCFGRLERCGVVVPCLESYFLSLRCKFVLLMLRLSVDGQNGGHLNFRKSQGLCINVTSTYIS